MSLYDRHLEKGMTESTRERLVYVQGILLLLKETDFFGPLIERALKNIEFILEESK